ncbi:MAG: hypothetical protein JWR87_226 [Segetibacter sp.]|jgi:hypothetical protein|nr:hypothetical protein [Segetibacter sp.]
MISVKQKYMPLYFFTEWHELNTIIEVTLQNEVYQKVFSRFKRSCKRF